MEYIVPFQSKEIGLQLQEDLMKVLNELYTVSPGDLHHGYLTPAGDIYSSEITMKNNAH